jgi:PAS domain S-box-containing protein
MGFIKPYSSWRISSKVLLAIILPNLIFAISSSIIQNINSSKTLNDITVHYLEIIADNSAEELTTKFSNIANSSQQLADFVRITANEPPLQQEQLVSLLESIVNTYPEVLGVWVSYNDGNSLSMSDINQKNMFKGSSGNSILYWLNDFKNSKNFTSNEIAQLERERALDTKKDSAQPIFINPYKSVVYNQDAFVFTMTYPVLNEQNQIIAVIAIDVGLAEIQPILERLLDININWQVPISSASIVDENGLYIAHTNPTLINANIAPPKLDIWRSARPLLEEKKHFGDFYDINKEKYLVYSLVKIPALDKTWSLALSLPFHKVVDTYTRSFLRPVLETIWLAKSASFIMAFIVAYYISLTLVDIIKILKKLSDGDYDIEIKEINSNDEAGRLTKVAKFFQASSKQLLIAKQRAEQAQNKIAEINQNLEKRIDESTSELREKEADLRIIINNLIDGIIIVNDQWIILRINPAIERIFGYSGQEVIGKNIKMLVSSRYTLTSEGGLQRYVQTKLIKNDFYQEVEGLHKDGTVFPMTIALSEMTTSSGEKTFVGLARDISKEKQDENQLRAYAQTLEIQREELIKAKIEAEKASAAKTEFLANMSHELRTPMHGILGFTRQGIKRIGRWNNEEQLENYGLIKESGERLLLLLNTLLDLSKLEAGEVNYDFQPGNILDTIKSVIVQLKPLIEQKNIIITVNGAENIPVLTFDSFRITEVIINLLSNSIKFTPENKTITITIEPEKTNFYKISVIDQGIGIPEDELEDIFNKFVQSKKTKTGAGGTGLGLSICKEIILAHGGKIWASNTESGGACFSFTLPIVMNELLKQV